MVSEMGNVKIHKLIMHPKQKLFYVEYKRQDSAYVDGDAANLATGEKSQNISCNCRCLCRAEMVTEA